MQTLVVGAWGGRWGGSGGWWRRGCRERLSFEFCRRKNQPLSFPRCRFEAGHGRTRVQSGPAAKRHHRKIRRLFLRGTRQNPNESLYTTSCGRRARQGDCGKGLEGRRRRCNVRWEEGERVQGSGFREGIEGVAGGRWGGAGGGGGRGTATRTDTDKHGQTRTFFRGQNSEVRESPEVVFPRYGKFIFDFSMLWKNNFHGVENLGRYGARGADFFHGVEKMFPQCGKVLWGDGAAGGGRWGVAGGVGGAGAGAPVEEGEAGEE
jgi:hypothetical protein